MSRVLRYLPKAWLSWSAGRVARSSSSRLLIPWFARHYGVDRAAAVVPEGGYANLQQFFCRQLLPTQRPVDASPRVLVSPVDGTLGASGVIEEGQLWQAKGHRYSLAALLGDAEAASRFRGGRYCTLYLAPGDYHRVHAPTAGRVRTARYIPGAYWPVNPQAVARIPGLFTSNERLVTELETGGGQVALVMVGACLVGGIRVNYDPAWNAGPGPHRAAERHYDPAAVFARGQELGRFEFGSTVIVLSEAAMGGETAALPGGCLHFGEPLLKF